MRPRHRSCFRDGRRHLRFLLVHRHLFVTPGAVMFRPGPLVARVTPNHIEPLGREWDIHTLIAGVLLSIVGTQVIGLGLCAHAYGTYFMGERDAWFDRMRARFRLEHGLLAGAFIVAGIVVGAFIVVTWIKPGLRPAPGGAHGGGSRPRSSPSGCRSGSPRRRDDIDLRRRDLHHADLALRIDQAERSSPRRSSSSSKCAGEPGSIGSTLPASGISTLSTTSPRTWSARTSPTRAWIFARGLPASAEIDVTMRREVVGGFVGAGVGVVPGVTCATPGRVAVGRGARLVTSAVRASRTANRTSRRRPSMPPG